MNNEQHGFFCDDSYIHKGGFFMPRTKFQEIIFTIIMVFVMVYTMICYNIALNIGEMNYSVFLMAFHELIIMAPAAFVLDYFFVGKAAKKAAFQIVNPQTENPFHLILAISIISVMWMCPFMSIPISSRGCYTPVKRLFIWTALKEPTFMERKFCILIRASCATPFTAAL